MESSARGGEERRDRAVYALARATLISGDGKVQGLQLFFGDPHANELVRSVVINKGSVTGTRV